ncbi:hypothetical protein ABZP36_000846 [Zizania latifolia]
MPDEHVPAEPLDPIKPSWSMNLGYYQSCTYGTPAEFENHILSSSELGDITRLFVTSFYPQQTQIYGQYHGDENVSLQTNWQCNWNVLSENDSQSFKTVLPISSSSYLQAWSNLATLLDLAQLVLFVKAFNGKPEGADPITEQKF